MSEIIHGHCGLVRLEFAGDETTALVASGGTDIPVGDVSDFNDAGGLLTFSTAETGATTVAYTILDDGDESGAPMLRLGTPLASDLDAGSLVYVWNPSPAGLIAEWVASVVDDTDGGVVEATVPHALIEKLGENVTALLGRSVTAERVGNVWYIADVLGSEPIISEPNIVGGTITGAHIRTAATGKRWEIDSATQNEIRAYSGHANESAPGSILVDVDDTVYGGPVFIISPPAWDTAASPEIVMSTDVTTGDSAIEQRADYVIAEAAGGISSQSISTLMTTAGFQIRRRVGAFGAWSAGPAIRGIDFGSFSSTANASGDLAVSHSLGVAPSSVMVIPMQTSVARMFSVVATSSSSFTVRSRDDTGATVASGATIAGYFIAIS